MFIFRLYKERSMALRITTYYHPDDLPDLPEKSLFHSEAFFRLLIQTPGYTPCMLVAHEDGAYVGRLLYAVRKGRGCFSFFSKCTVYGCGDYVIDEQRASAVFDELLDYMTRTLPNTVSLVEFRNLENGLFGYKSFISNQYFPVKWLRIRNSVQKQRTGKWMSVSRRRQIRRALRAGVSMRVVSDEVEGSVAYRMLKRFYASKWHRYLPQEAFFKGLLTMMKERNVGKMIEVVYEGKVIGAAVCLYSSDTSYLFYSGGLRKTYAHLYPGVMAVWYAMTDAQCEGKRYLEFINAGLPYRRYGFRDFILRFGGQQLGSRRWYRLRWEWANRLFGLFYR